MTTHKAAGSDPRLLSSHPRPRPRAGADTHQDRVAAASAEELKREGDLPRSGHSPRVGLRDPHLVLAYAALVGAIGIATVSVIVALRAEPQDLARVLRALPRIPVDEASSSQ